MSEVDWWRGAHGDEYTARNAELNIEARMLLWRGILNCLDGVPGNILEIGAGGGANLQALWLLGQKRLRGIEPNEEARNKAMDDGFAMHDGTAANPGFGADLVFTSGVLIHIPPEDLFPACKGIFDAAGRYIVSIEYFSAEPEEKAYRGRRLWKRDFGSFWLDNFDLRPLGCGFAWSRMTGLDNLTWWAFAK